MLVCNYQWTTQDKRYDIRGSPALYGKLNMDNYVSRCQQKCLDNPFCTGIDYLSGLSSAAHAREPDTVADRPWCWIVIPGSRPQKTNKPDIVHSDMTRNCPKATTGQRYIICHRIIVH